MRQRFFAKTKMAASCRPGMATPCREWTASRDKNGYGRFRVSGVSALAHRVAWCLEHGAVPDGLCVLHRCDNPPCVNGEHLFLGTQADNNADMVAKGRQVAGISRGDAHGSRRHPECLVRGEKHPNSRLTEGKVNRIFALRAQGLSQTRIACACGVNQSSVSDVLRGKSWTHLRLVA